MATLVENVNKVVTAFSDIKQAITDKGVEVPSDIGVSGYAAKIEEIKGNGIDTSDATAVASDIRSGKTAYVNDNKVSGTLKIDSFAIKYGSRIGGVRGIGYQEPFHGLWYPWNDTINEYNGTYFINNLQFFNCTRKFEITVNSARTHVEVRLLSGNTIVSSANLIAINYSTQKYKLSVKKLSGNEFLVVYYLANISTSLYGPIYIRKISISPTDYTISLGTAITLQKGESSSTYGSVLLLRSLFSKYAFFVIVGSRKVSTSVDTFSYYSIFLNSNNNTITVKKTTDESGNAANVVLGNDSTYSFRSPEGFSIFHNGYFCSNGYACLERRNTNTDVTNYYTLAGITPALPVRRDTIPSNECFIYPKSCGENGLFEGSYAFDKITGFFYLVYLPNGGTYDDYENGF